MVIGPYVMAMSDAVTAFFSVDVPAPRATSLHSFVGEPQMLAAVESMFDPTTSVRVLHSDRYDCIAAPAPPPGCTYILRCRGRGAGAYTRPLFSSLSARLEVFFGCWRVFVTKAAHVELRSGRV